jgi:hypothetical protein
MSFLREPANIQISRVSSNFVFPWGLVYDIPLQPLDSEKHKICKIVDLWQDGEALPVEGVYSCPHSEEHELNTICPFGFWGMRHVIEQPPSAGKADDLVSEIRVSRPPPRLFVCTSAELEREYTTSHLDEITKVLTKFRLVACQSKDELLTRLKTVEAGIVYIYCYGGRLSLAGTKGSIPYLGVGAAEKMTPDDVLAYLGGNDAQLYWRVSNPLVFVNGCHTAELTPEGLVNFVDTFAGLYSSGVIGTEVTVHQLLANEAGTAFLRRFVEDATVGEALCEMRTHLLSKGNLMGLAYTAYCLAGLRLADAANTSDAEQR